MGDSSISSDSAGDRSISPSRSDETPAIPTITSNSPTPPSPVLVSKRLAEEAMIKRNSQLMMNQPKAPARSPQVNGNRSATTKSKKRPAPLPPGPVNHRPQVIFYRIISYSIAMHEPVILDYSQNKWIIK